MDWLSVKQDHATATSAQPVRKQDAQKTAEAHVRWGPVRPLRVQPTVPPLTAEPLAAVKLAAAQTARPAAVQPIARQLEGRVRFFFCADILGYPKRALIYDCKFCLVPKLDGETKVPDEILQLEAHIAPSAACREVMVKRPSAQRLRILARATRKVLEDHGLRADLAETMVPCMHWL